MRKFLCLWMLVPFYFYGVGGLVGTPPTSARAVIYALATIGDAPTYTTDWCIAGYVLKAYEGYDPLLEACNGPSITMTVNGAGGAESTGLAWSQMQSEDNQALSLTGDQLANLISDQAGTPDPDLYNCLEVLSVTSAMTENAGCGGNQSVLANDAVAAIKLCPTGANSFQSMATCGTTAKTLTVHTL